MRRRQARSREEKGRRGEDSGFKGGSLPRFHRGVAAPRIDSPFASLGCGLFRGQADPGARGKGRQSRTVVVVDDGDEPLVVSTGVKPPEAHGCDALHLREADRSWSLTSETHLRPSAPTDILPAHALPAPSRAH
ncbi:hypothetical protein KM043_004639 [Ampulex compressa]|nr:hypothetical protein KM043_004639 [Ampulex compressa]